MSWWVLVKVNTQSLWWALEHWLLTHAFSLQFCHSCSGYFREGGMMLPGKCEACYARDYGIPVQPGAVITSPWTSDRE